MKIKWFLHQLDCIYSETNENNSISLREFWSTMRQWCHFTIHYDYFILNSKIYYIISRVFFKENTAQKSKFSIKDFFSKCEKIRSFLRIWSHFLKKSLMENFTFCAIFFTLFMSTLKLFHYITFDNMLTHSFRFILTS